MNTRRAASPFASLSLFAALVLLPSCSDDGTQTSTTSGSSSGSSSGGGSGGEGGNASGGMGGAGGGMGGGGMGGGGGGSLCVPGSNDFCYSGPPGTEIIGVCKAGSKTCLADGTGYGPCMGEVTPSAESCATMGDDDCDGMVNEEGADCACQPNTTTTCYSAPMNTLDVGDCKAGTQACNAQGTAYGPCIGEVVPQAESCALPGDQNCDGQINEGCVCVPNSTAACYTGPMNTQDVGDCKAGMQTCNAQGTAFGPCMGEVVPQMETCALPGDEDCDGQINEGGVNCVCVPNTTAPCYTGPMGTQNVGICMGGTQTCNAQGTAYGPCLGEVVPQMETCALPGDEDCDGQTNEGGISCVCMPNSTEACYTGPMGTSGVGNCMAGTHACNAQGTAYGPCIGEVLPVAESCNTSGDDDCDNMINEGCIGGPTLWTKPLGDVAEQDIFDVATDTQGNIYVVGQFSGTVDFGGGPLTTPTSNSDIFIAKYDALGTHVWSQRYGGNGTDGARGVAVDAFGNVLVTGVYQATVDFGGGPFVSVNGTHDIFMLALTSNGGYLISRSFGSAGGDEGSSVSFDAGGNAIVVGHIAGSVDFGGGMLPWTGNDDAFIAKFSSFGFHLWSKSFGDAMYGQYIKDVATDANGDVYCTGYFAGNIDFGGGPLTSVPAADGFVVKFSAAAGTHVWTRGITGASGQAGHSIAIDPMGNVVATGYMFGTVDFGLGPLTSAGNGDIYVAKYSSTGQPQWAKIFGDTFDQRAWGVKTDAQGNVVVVGAMAGSVDFGGGALTSGGGNDIFITKLNPAGDHAWSKRAGDALEQWTRAVATDSSGNAIAVGRFQGTIDFGTGPLTSAGGNDGFVVKFGP